MQLDVLRDSLRASRTFVGRHRPRFRDDPRMRYSGLGNAARRRGWSERTTTQLWAAAKREFAVPTTDHMLTLITADDWIAFYERCFGDH